MVSNVGQLFRISDLLIKFYLNYFYYKSNFPYTEYDTDVHVLYVYYINTINPNIYC